MRGSAAATDLAVVDAGPPRSDFQESGEAALRRAGHACLDHLVRYTAAARTGDPEGIHQMRVGVRRLRAILSALGPFLAREPRRWASDQLRWLADVLGEARNLDVFAAEILVPARDALPDASEFERLARVIDRRREIAQSRVRAGINSRRYRRSVAVLTRWLDEYGWRGPDESMPSRPIGELAPLVLERCRRQVQKRSKHFGEQSEEQRHELRIALKKLRYATELLAGLYDKDRTERFIKRVRRIQDDLGYRNDVRVARDLIAAMVGPGAPDIGIALAGRRVLGWHRRRITSDELRLQRRVRTLLQSKPFWSATIAKMKDPEA